MTDTSPIYAAMPEISREIWDAKYRMKELDGTPIDGSPEDTMQRIARALAVPENNASGRFADSFFNTLATFNFMPAGRIVAGAGSDRNVTLFNCFVMGTIPDSMKGIFEMLKEAALTMQAGGGIGYDFSPIRPKGAPVKGVAADASGPLTFMDCWDAMCRTVMSAGSRRGAMMATMRCDHPDIEDFITAKQDASKLRMFNVSVLVTDSFMDAVKSDADWPLVHTVPPLSDAKALDELGDDGRGNKTRWVYKTVKARELWDKIMESTYNAAEPGVIFIDRVNQRNNLRYVEKIAASNPCGEQMLPPYGACLLGSVNLAMMVSDPFGENPGLDAELLKNAVYDGVRMMDNVIDVSKMPLEAQAAEAQAKRRIGLGVTGLANALAMCKLRYGSDKAADTVRRWMRQIAIHAYEASVALAKEKGAFPLFDADQFLEAGTFAGDMLPTKLKDEIRKHGIRNALLTSIAPTGTISLYSFNVSSGIEPVFAYGYTRKVLQPDGSKVERRVEDYAVARYRKYWREVLDPDAPGPFHENFLPDYFVTAQTLTPAEHVKMQAAAQEWVDNSISKTINCPEDISFEDFKAVYMDAYESGCKGCTTYRPNDITGSVLSVDKPVEEAGTEPLSAEEADYSGDAAMPGLFEPEDFDTVGWGTLTVLDEAGEVALTGDLEQIDEETDADGQTHVTVTLTDTHKAAWVDTDDGPVAAISAPVQARPEALDAEVYKIKLGDGPAIYVTISDILEDGKRRPFEVFISTKNPEHFEWTTALTRMVSAVFRRGGDVAFVAAELKEVFSPAGGGFWRGAYRNSTVAAIGQVIQDHMEKIGYGPWALPDDSLARGLMPMRRVEAQLGQGGRGDAAEKAKGYKLQRGRDVMSGSRGDVPGTMAYEAVVRCPTCFSANVKHEAGCLQCLDCGDSKCG